MSLLNKILFTPQTLTDDQKRIARENIGAAADVSQIYFDPNTISGDGSENNKYTVKSMEGATAQANGKGGIVPAPVGGDANFDKRVLCGSGEWNPLIPVTDAEIDELFVESVN